MLCYGQQIIHQANHEKKLNAAILVKSKAIKKIKLQIFFYSEPAAFLTVTSYEAYCYLLF